MTITPKKRLTGIIVFVLSLLLIPLIAMQFSEEVDWSVFDFFLMGVLLLLVGLGCEYILRRFKQTTHRALFIAGILFLFFLIWAELAVGVFGTPFAGS